MFLIFLKRAYILWYFLVLNQIILILQTSEKTIEMKIMSKIKKNLYPNIISYVNKLAAFI